MEYVQERVATLHDFGSAEPPAPVDRATVVVPMTHRDHASLAAERVLSHLATVDPERVIVALHAEVESVPDVVAWLETLPGEVDVLWCTAPGVRERLADADLDGDAGKGRDVWLGLGQALSSEYVVVHDADATTYDETHVPRLLFPLTSGYRFSKGYYARVENGRLYGRLARLFVAPLLATLSDRHDAGIVEFFEAFRYPLAGEFAATTEFASQFRAQRDWGLELGTLGEVYRLGGFADAAQVDLGVHEHDHRSVGGPDGLGDMCRQVGSALFRALTDAGLAVDFETLPDRLRVEAERLVSQYAIDADFNDFSYDRADERHQVDTYADAVEAPGPDERLPAWAETAIDPADIWDRSENALASFTEG